MVNSFSKKEVMLGTIVSLFLLTAITAYGESRVVTSSKIGNLAYGEKVQVLKHLEDIKRLLENRVGGNAIRASRPDSPSYGDPSYPVPLPASLDSVLLEEIRCLICIVKKYLGKINHTDYWESLVDTIECSDVDEPVPDDFGDAVDMLARALTEVLVRIGCIEDCTLVTFPDDILGRLCYIKLFLEMMDSKLDTIIEHAETIESKVFAQNEEILTIDSKIDNIIEHVETIESKVFAQNEEILTIESEVDRIESKIGEPWDTLNFDLLPSSTQETNDATYSVIQWLKAIYYHVYNEV